MTFDRTTAHSRALEGLLWIAVLLAGGAILLPSAVDFIAARQAEQESHQQASESEQNVKDLGHKIYWLVHDPQRDEKLAERQGLSIRMDSGPSSNETPEMTEELLSTEPAGRDGTQSQSTPALSEESRTPNALASNPIHD